VPRSDDIRLDLVEFRLLRELFNEHSGLVFAPETRIVLERRLRDRLSVLGLSSFGEYYQLLRFDERGRAEMEEALDLVTINETYFFREAYQLRAYKDEILPALRAPHTRERLSVWSAGCSTGEEVYSIAMLTRESGNFPGRSVRIFGSDVSRRCLAHARRGVYGPSSFRAMPTELRRRYFVDKPDGAHIVDDLRSICQFGHLNLLDTPRSSVVGRVDVIFCRNVLIYFDDVARRRVIEMFYERLLPGGYLLLGHSESLLNVSTAFELVHLREDLVYRKPVSSTRFWSSGDFFQRGGEGALDPGRSSLVPFTPPVQRPQPAPGAASPATPGPHGAPGPGPQRSSSSPLRSPPPPPPHVSPAAPLVSPAAPHASPPAPLASPAVPGAALPRGPRGAR
jgi:chemotaxis protein methyltransferase CheR